MTNLEWLKTLESVAPVLSFHESVEAPGKTVVDRLPRNLVMHAGTGVVGQVKHVWVPGEYVSVTERLATDVTFVDRGWRSGNPERTSRAHVLELEEGHTFIFKPSIDASESEFKPVQPKEAHYFLMIVGSLDVLVKSSASLGKAVGLDFNSSKQFLVAALERAVRALKTTPTPSSHT